MGSADKFQDSVKMSYGLGNVFLKCVADLVRIIFTIQIP